jgi:hypothetical protein
MGSVVEFEQAGIFLADDPGRGVRWQVWPDEITDEKEVQWSDIPIIGRSEPIKTYFMSRQRTFGFTLAFVSSVDQDDSGDPAIVAEKVRFLRALTYPRRSPGGLVLGPPVVYLIVGDLIRSRCVVRSVRATYSGAWIQAARTRLAVASPSLIGPPAPVQEVDSRNNLSLPLMIPVQIQLDEVNQLPLDFQEVLDGEEFVQGGVRPF